MLSKQERMRLFLRRVERAVACASAEEALELIAVTLNAVEDEFTSIPFNPALWQSDGRLYPPQEDQRREVESFPAIARYRSRHHNTWIGANGAIRITEGMTTCVLEKAGTDGQTITALMVRSKSKA